VTEPKKITIAFEITPQTTHVDGEEGWPVTVTGKKGELGVVFSRVLSDWSSITDLAVEVHDKLNELESAPPAFPDLGDKKVKKAKKSAKNSSKKAAEQKPAAQQKTLF